MTGDRNRRSRASLRPHARRKHLDPQPVPPGILEPLPRGLRLGAGRRARARPAGAEAGSVRADGEGVEFAAITHYIGPSDYARRARAVRREARAAVDPRSAVIMRVGSHLAALIEPMLRRRGQPYAVEVIYDPYDMFAPGSMTHPTRPFFRWFFPRQLRKHCAHATAAAYVTEHALQRRYPPLPAPTRRTTRMSSCPTMRSSDRRPGRRRTAPSGSSRWARSISCTRRRMSSSTPSQPACRRAATSR